MTPTNKRNLMLATSGLMGLAGLASMTLGVTDANAACALQSGVLVCDTSDGTTDASNEINPLIAAQPGPDIQVNIVGTNPVDTAPGAVVVANPPFKGAVVFTASTSLGKADAGDSKFAALGTDALAITGDPAAAGNTTTVNLNAVTNGNIVVSSVGGLTTLNVNKDVRATSGGVGGKITVTDSLGGVTLVQAAGAVISGAVSLDAKGVLTAGTPVINGTTKTTTSVTTGGAANVTLNDNVGFTTKGAGFNTNTGQPNPDVFTAAAVTVTATTGATVTQSAGSIGALTVDSTATKVVLVEDTSAAGGFTTKSIVTTTSGMGGDVSFTQAAGATQVNNASFATDGNITINVSGTYAQSKAGTKSLTATAGVTPTVVTTDVVVDDGAVTTSDLFSTKTTSSSSKVTFNALAGSVAGDATAPSAINLTGPGGVTATVGGTTGRLAINAVATEVLDSDLLTYEPGVGNGKLLTVQQIDTSKNLKSAVTLTVTGTASSAAATDSTITAGGAITVDVQAGGRLNGLVVDGTGGATDTNTSVVTTFDKTGPLTSQIIDLSSAGTGGDISLTFNGNSAGSPLTGSTPNNVDATGHGDITATIGKVIVGNMNLKTTVVDAKQKITSLTPLTGDVSVTNNYSAAASGGAVNYTLASGGTVGDQTGTAISITADKSSKVTLDGTVRGNVVVNTAPAFITTLDNNLDSITTTTPAANVTVVTTIDNRTVKQETVGGSATVANNSLKSILGNLTVTALGDVNLTHPGFTSGNVTLVSSGTSVDLTSTSTKVNKVDPVGALALTDAKVVTDTVDFDQTLVTAATGGNVVADYSGIVGLENASPPLVGGTLVSQTADKNSTATVSGTLFTDLSSTAGAFTTTEIDTFDSVLVKNFDKNNPGSILLMASGSGTDTTTAKDTKTANLGVSTVTVSGSLKQDVGGGTSNLTSTGQGGSTVTVSGSVQGSVTSTATASNTQTDFTRTDTKRFVAATSSTLAEIGTLNSKRVESSSSTSTVVGGSSTVSITGKATLVTPTVGGSVNSTANTTSTVTIGGDSLVGGGVGSTVSGQDTGSTYDLTSTRGATGTWTHTEKFTSKNTVSKVSGASSVTVSAPTQSTIPTGVNGGVGVDSDTGAATATIANRVAFDVDVTAIGTNFNDVTNVGTTSSAAGGQFGAKTNTAFDYTSTNAEVGGKASATVSSPLALSQLNQPVIGDDLRVRGSTATIDIAAGAIVGGGGADVNTNSVLKTDGFKQVDTFTTGVLATRTLTTTNTFVGGASTNNIGGEVSGQSTAFGQTATVNVLATGTVGALSGSGNVTADALFESFQRVDTQTGLAAGPVGFSKTVVDTYTPVTGGVALVDVKGVVAGNAHAEGATATVNNSATSYIGSVTVGGAVNNYALTTLNTPTASTPTVKANTLFVQNSTVNQNGFIESGIFANSAFISSPVDGSLLQTSDQKATFNLNSGSTTMGYTGGAYNAITNQLFTTTTVNLNGTGFVGWDGVNKADVKTNADYNVFNSAPTLTKQVASFVGGSGTGSIEGFTTLNHTGPGTFFILGPSHDDNNTASRNDDTFAIRGTTFNNTSGRLEFATDDDLFFGGVDDVFAIMSKTTNSGEFVLGRTVALVPVNNISSLLNTQTAIQGQHFLHVGDFTQTATGSLIIGGTPDLLRVGDIGLVGAGAPEPLGFFQFGIGAGPFTLASNSGAPLVDSSMRVEGNLNLAGKIVVANQRGGLQNDGVVNKLFTVTGTVTNTATVAPLFASNFVTFEVTTTKVGNETILSVGTKRTSFGTVALNDNALAVAEALDSAVPTVIDMITKDANGLPVFSTVQQFNEVQDLAKIIAGFDWTLGLPDVSAALNEMASGDLYASLNGVDPLAQFNEATIMNGMGLMEGGGRLWAQPAYRTVTIDGDANTGAGEIKSSEAGLFFGGSFQPTEAWNWGVAFGYQGSEVDGEEKPYSAEVNSYLVGFNAGWRSGPIHIGGGLNYAASNIEARRSLTILARDITADYDSHSFGIDLMGSYDFADILGGTVTPYLRVNFRNVSTDGFRESLSGGGVALNVAKFSETFTTPELGVFWSRNEWDAGFATINPYLGLSILFNSFENESTQNLVGGGNTFVIKGVDPSTSAQLSAGFSGGVGDLGSFSLGVTGQFGDMQGVGANATFRIHFD